MNDWSLLTVVVPLLGLVPTLATVDRDRSRRRVVVTCLATAGCGLVAWAFGTTGPLPGLMLPLTAGLFAMVAATIARAELDAPGGRWRLPTLLAGLAIDSGALISRSDQTLLLLLGWACCLRWWRCGPSAEGHAASRPISGCSSPPRG